MKRHLFFFSSRRRHTRLQGDWSSDVCSSDLRDSLLNLQARLRGDLDQMTDEALRRGQPDSSGNLSNVPLHMADVGTENYDQEFTLSLIENEQDTLGQIHDAL